jgi:predicted DNA-binding transcriptional regulator
MKYDSKNEIEENQKLKIEKIQNEIKLEKQKSRVLLLFYFITTGIIATLGIVKYLYSKNKRDKIKTEIETENRISKKLHDEVANDLFQMITFAETRDLELHYTKHF